MENFKVNFMILGAMKCGTTTLSSILKNHPEIAFCKTNEPNFFCSTKNWKTNLKDYHTLFNFEEGKIQGEASTNYTKYPHLNKNIWRDLYEYNCDLKFIYIVRNPVDRSISHYMHRYERAYTNSTITGDILTSNIINVGRYYTQIKPFIDTFGLTNILIIDFDELINGRTKVLKEISSFLNINFNKFENFEKVHENISIGGNKSPIYKDKYIKYFRFLNVLTETIKKIMFKLFLDNSKRAFMSKPEISQEYKEAIINLNMLDIIELEKITNKDFSKWKTI